MGESSVIRSLLHGVLLVSMSSWVVEAGAAADPFVPAPELAPDFEFWKRIYSEVATSGGLLHDARYLHVVYEVITVSFLAALDIDRNAEKFFGPLLRDPPADFHAVRIGAYVPVAALERRLRIERAALQNLNLALRPAVWEGRRLVPRGYDLRVPDTGAERDPAALLADLGAGERFSAQIGDAFHAVRRGETLGHTARTHGTTVAWLVRANGLSSPKSLRVGRVLGLPGEMPGRVHESTVAAGADTYIVRRGDTLSAIATRVGMAEKDLMAGNSLRDRDSIYEGQRLSLVMQNPAAETSGPDEEASELLAEESRDTAVESTPSSEPVSRDEAVDESPALVGGGALGMSADPTDYGVDARGTIEVQAAETLGHYAEWLGVSAAGLRKLNHMKSSQALRVGRRLALDLSRVTARKFEQRRVDYHRRLQERFFSGSRIAGTDRYRVQPGESVWVITQKPSSVPVWLLRQYNPEVDLGNVRPGTELVIPRIVPVTGNGG